MNDIKGKVIERGYCYVNDLTDEPTIPERKSANSIVGIAHEYAQASG